MIQACTYLMVGVANSQYNVNGLYNHSTSCVSFLHNQNGSKYPSQTPFGIGFCQNGNTIQFEYNNGLLRSIINGTDYSYAYSGLAQNLQPAIDIAYLGAIVEFQCLE